MNNNSSRGDVMEDLRGAGLPGSLQYVQDVYESRRTGSAIFTARTDFKLSRTRDALCTAQRITSPPVMEVFRPASLGSSTWLSERSTSGMGNGPRNRWLPKRLRRGVLYEA
jgi:hypothetical protein